MKDCGCLYLIKSVDSTSIFFYYCQLNKLLECQRQPVVFIGFLHADNHQGKEEIEITILYECVFRLGKAYLAL